MLSDEEREALDKLSSKKNESTWDDTIRQIKREEIKDVVVTRQKYITAVLNLIEKQSKEIEELKAISEYREKIIKGLGLKTLPKTITGFKELIENNDKKWQDKIKAKIEEINKEMLNEENSLELFYRKKYCKEALQSLLEKE